ncbi:MAG: S24 family peptidase [Gammaproteobacteria bacterium]
MAVNLQERLQVLMKRKGNLSEIDLVKLSGLPQPTVHHILSGATKRPHRKSLIALANGLDVSINDLFEEEDDSDGGSRIIQINIIDWRQAAQWPNHAIPDETQVRTAITDADVSDNCFGLIIKDSSMETLFPVGTLLVVDPNREPQDKSYVVVQLKDSKEAVFKQLLINSNHYYLKSLNPLFDKLELMPMSNDDRIIAVVAQARVNFN